MKEFIRIENLSFVNKQKTILDSVNLSISEGKILALLGPNGSGKSTLLELILSDFRPSLGSIEYHFDKKRYFKKHIGVVYNNQQLFPQLYVKEVLDFYQNIYRDSGEYLSVLIELFDLVKLQKSLVRELSEGEKKKLSIVLALFHKPKFVVMDEPFASVDVTVTEIIWKEIKKLNATVILATHDWTLAEKYSDEALFLEEGKVLKEKIKLNNSETNSNPDRKLVAYKTKPLEKALGASLYYEKDNQIHIKLSPELDLELIKSITFNYTITELKLEDIYYFLTKKQETKCSETYI